MCIFEETMWIFCKLSLLVSLDKLQYHQTINMTKSITFLLATIFAITSFGQTFEGEIVYKNTYKSKLPNVTSEQFTTMIGSTQEYFIENGDYK